MILLPWSKPLIVGTLIRRRHRFIADIVLTNGEQVIAHCPEPGRMEGLVRQGAQVWLSPRHGVVSRRLEWTWELVQIDDIPVGINSQLANNLFRRILEERCVPGLKSYENIQVEAKIAKNTRVDFRLTSKSRSHFIEVKSCTLVYADRCAYFPSSLTSRAVRQVKALARARKAGHLASFIVVVQRPDALRLRFSYLHDSTLVSAIRSARKVGVRVRAFAVRPSPTGIEYVGELPVDFSDSDVEQLQHWRTEWLGSTGWERPKGDPFARWRKTRA